MSETNFDRNGSDDSPDVTSAGSTTSGAKQGSDGAANGSARSPSRHSKSPRSLSHATTFWYQQTILESDVGILSSGDVQGRRFVFGHPPQATGESLCGSRLVFSPDELAFHEAKVTHFYPRLVMQNSVRENSFGQTSISMNI